MMGRQDNDRNQLFYQFDLDDLVPKDHLLRYIDAVLDLKRLHPHLAPFYSHTGRPSIDPELMIRMLLIGYCFGIRSERRLCEEVQLNLAYRWFCRLSIEDPIPDHSTFSKARHGRFRESDALRFVFEQVVERCIQEGFVGAAGFAIDASVIKADANRQRALDRDNDDDWPTPNLSTRPVREYLSSLDPKQEPPKRISLTDPQARWTAAPGGPAFFAYSTNYLIDVAAGIVMDVEATAAYRPDEVSSTKTMVDRVEDRFGIKPTHLIGDTAYSTTEMLHWMVDEKEIEPHVPMYDQGERNDGTFSRSKFEFDQQSDTYTCPGGHLLKRFWRTYHPPRTGINRKGEINYRSRKGDCNRCPLKMRCCPNTDFRRLMRSIHEAARDVARQVRHTDRYKQSRKDRKKVEMLFGHLKRILKLDRLRLRGMSGAHDEFLLAATAQNLRRLGQWMNTGPPLPSPSPSG